MTVIDAYDRFILKKRLKNLSSKTIENYNDIVLPFIDYIGRSSDVQIIDTDIVIAYIQRLYKRQLADASRATYIRHIKAFVRWLKDYYNIPVALSEIEIPKTGKKNVHILTQEEIVHIFSCISGSPEWIRIRNCCAIALMLGSGLRQNEVSTLLWKNVDFNTRSAIVHGKGNKERPVPLGNTSITFLLEYRMRCPYQNEFVFCERRGNQWSNNAIKLMVQRLKQVSGIDISSHEYRHNYATLFCIDSLERTGQCDAHTLQILMGHTDIKTTEQYLHYAKQLVAIQNNNSHLDMVFGVWVM